MHRNRIICIISKAICMMDNFISIWLYKPLNNNHFYFNKLINKIISGLINHCWIHGHPCIMNCIVVDTSSLLTRVLLHRILNIKIDAVWTVTLAVYTYISIYIYIYTYVFPCLQFRRSKENERRGGGGGGGGGCLVALEYFNDRGFCKRWGGGGVVWWRGGGGG